MQLELYLQNQSVGITKDSYLKICKEMGEEPIEEKTPPDFDDFPDKIQDILVMYSIFPSQFEYMNGNYIGKDYNLLEYLFNMFDVEDKLDTIGLLKEIDQINSDIINSKKKK